MPAFNTRVAPYKPPSPISFQWDSFRGGLNTLLRPTELQPNELSQADNLWLVGSGVPTKRPGTSPYYLGNATGSVQMVKGVYLKNGSNEVFSIVGGIPTQKSSASYVVVPGASFMSGASALAHGVILQNSLYIVNGVDKLTKYLGAGASLIRFKPLSAPTISGLTLVSGASINPSKSYSYKITALSPVGETLATLAASLASGPQNLSTSLARLSWVKPSAASGDLIGFQIYGRDPGNETFLAFVGPDTTTFDDNGVLVASGFTNVPSVDTSDGPVAKYIDKLKDKIVLAGIAGEPSRLMWSGGGNNVDKFHWSFGGGYVDISKDDGDSITGIKSFGGTADRLIVFKERSIWQVTLNVSGSLVIPTVTLITNSRGCVSHRTIVAVENDIFFLSRNGVYVIGNEPNILGDILRTNELSAKIRPNMEALNYAQISNAAAVYWNYKYILTYPDSTASNNSKMLSYDRERLSWMGPWNIGASGFEVYYDSSRTEHLLLGDPTDPYITEMSTTYRDDNGTTISTFLRTRKEIFKDWSIFKTIEDIFVNFRNVLGTVSVNIRLEGKTGETTTAKSFDVASGTGASGWGTDQWGSIQWGLSRNIAGSALNEIVKQAHLIKTARAFQVEIQTSNRNDAYELIGIRGDARVQSPGARPSAWRV